MCFCVGRKSTSTTTSKTAKKRRCDDAASTVAKSSSLSVQRLVPAIGIVRECERTQQRGASLAAFASATARYRQSGTASTANDRATTKLTAAFARRRQLYLDIIDKVYAEETKRLVAAPIPTNEQVTTLVTAVGQCRQLCLDMIDKLHAEETKLTRAVATMPTFDVPLTHVAGGDWTAIPETVSFTQLLRNCNDDDDVEIIAITKAPSDEETDTAESSSSSSCLFSSPPPAPPMYNGYWAKVTTPPPPQQQQPQPPPLLQQLPPAPQQQLPPAPQQQPPPLLQRQSSALMALLQPDYNDYEEANALIDDVVMKMELPICGNEKTLTDEEMTLLCNELFSEADSYADIILAPPPHPVAACATHSANVVATRPTVQPVVNQQQRQQKSTNRGSAAALPAPMDNGLWYQRIADSIPAMLQYCATTRDEIDAKPAFDYISGLNYVTVKEEMTMMTLPNGPSMGQGAQGYVYPFGEQTLATATLVTKYYIYNDYVPELEYAAMKRLNRKLPGWPQFPVVVNYSRTPGVGTIGNAAVVMNRIFGVSLGHFLTGSWLKQSEDVTTTTNARRPIYQFVTPTCRERMSVIAQTMAAAVAMRRVGKLLHNDLCSRNVMVRSTSTDVHIYHANGRVILQTPTYNWCPVIIDYGFAQLLRDETDEPNGVCAVASEKMLAPLSLVDNCMLPFEYDERRDVCCFALDAYYHLFQDKFASDLAHEKRDAVSEDDAMLLRYHRLIAYFMGRQRAGSDDDDDDMDICQVYKLMFYTVPSSDKSSLRLLFGLALFAGGLGLAGQENGCAVIRRQRTGGDDGNAILPPLWTKQRVDACERNLRMRCTSFVDILLAQIGAPTQPKTFRPITLHQRYTTAEGETKTRVFWPGGADVRNGLSYAKRVGRELGRLMMVCDVTTANELKTFVMSGVGNSDTTHEMIQLDEPMDDHRSNANVKRLGTAIRASVLVVEEMLREMGKCYKNTGDRLYAKYWPKTTLNDMSTAASSMPSNASKIVYKLNDKIALFDCGTGKIRRFELTNEEMVHRWNALPPLIAACTASTTVCQATMLQLARQAMTTTTKSDMEKAAAAAAAALCQLATGTSR